MEPHLYSLRPRYKDNPYKRVSDFTHKPKNVLPVPEEGASRDKKLVDMARDHLVRHETRHTHHLTEKQTECQAWWLFRLLGVTGTLADLVITLMHTKARRVFERNPAGRALLRLVGINFDNAQHSELQQHGALVGDDGITLQEYVPSVASSAVQLAKKSKSFLVSICSRYAISCRGTKTVLANRIWAQATCVDDIEPLTDAEQMRNAVVETIDAHLFHKPMKGGTEYTESGQANEKNLVKAAAELFAQGEDERIAAGGEPGQILLFACERGLVQSRYHSRMLFSSDAVGCIWRPHTQDELERYAEYVERAESDASGSNAHHMDDEQGCHHFGALSGVFTVVAIECKTFHDSVARARIDRMLRHAESVYVPIHLPASDIRPLEEPLNVEGDDESLVDLNQFFDADRMMGVIGNRKHICQLIAICGGAGMRRILYVAGSPNKAVQMVDLTQEMSSRGRLEERLGGFTLAHGEPNVTWPAWGVILAHVWELLLEECGARVLFDDEGTNVPTVIEDASYVQNTVARIQLAQLRASALRLALAQLEPVSTAKYIKHSSVAGWNSVGKAGVDDASRKANAIIPKNFPAGIACRLMLRVVSMQVLNSMQVWRICQSGRRLLEPAPGRSLAAMRQIITGRMPPSRFIAVLLRGRGLPGVQRMFGAAEGAETTSGVVDNGSEGCTYIRRGVCGLIGKASRAPGPPDLKALRFNRGDLIDYFNSDIGRNRRLSKRFSDLQSGQNDGKAIVDGHFTDDRSLYMESVPEDLKGCYTVLEDGAEVRSKPKSGKNCVLCSPRPSGMVVYSADLDSPAEDDSGSDGENCGESSEGHVRGRRVRKPFPKPASNRPQPKTKYVCIDCGGIFLCRVQRWKDTGNGAVRETMTCWDKFHTQESISKEVYCKPPSSYLA